MTSQSTVDTAVRSARSMSMWRLEWLRIARTSRWIVLFGVYLIFGLLGPVMAKYLPEIVGQVQSEMTIIVPPPQPKDGIVNYVNQVAQIGLIVVVTIAASALTFDARRGLSTFLRTRVNSMWALLQPRLVVTAAFAVLAYTLGTLAAWYETTLLLGPLPAAALAAGVLCESIYLIFSIAVVAAASAFARGTLGTVGIALTRDHCAVHRRRPGSASRLAADDARRGPCRFAHHNHAEQLPSGDGRRSWIERGARRACLDHLAIPRGLSCGRGGRPCSRSSGGGSGSSPTGWMPIGAPVRRKARSERRFRYYRPAVQ